MDLEIIETQNGGDLIQKLNDLSVIYGFENMPYLAMFGGNTEASTPTDRIDSEQAFDWWGNDLFFGQDPSLQMNSLTERTLNTVSLTSFGRKQIENAVKKDLEFMRDFATVSVSVVIIGLNKLAIAVKVVRLDNLDQRAFIYIWDATIRELEEKDAMLSREGDIVQFRIFDDSFDVSFE